MSQIKKIGGIEEDVLITGGIVVGGYFLIKNLLPDFLPSLGVSPQDKATLDAQQTVTDDQNIFKPTYPSAELWFIANSDYSHYGVDNDTDYLNAVYDDFVRGNLPPTSPFYPVMQTYYALYKGLIGHIFSGDQDGVNAALNTITNKWQLGVISKMLADINGQDFWKLLREGQFTMVYGLNGTDLAKQVTRLNSLPE